MTGDKPGDTAMRPRASRLDAARHLLHRAQLKESVALSPQPLLRNSALAGLQAATTAAIALPLVHLSPWSDLIGFASLGALVALFGRFAPAGRRNRIVLLCAICQILAVLVMSGAAWLGASDAAQLVLLAIACGVFLFVSVTGGFGAPGPLIFVFAAGASMSAGQPTAIDLAERVMATALVAGLALVICALSETLRHHPAPDRPAPAEPLRPLDRRLAAAARTTVGAGIAVFASHAFGADHPAWAAMGALAVMQGAHLHITMNRALQRMAGTVVGSVMAWVLLVQDPSAWTLIALLAVLQIATEVVIGTNYAFGQILVTPMALLMTHLGAPEGAGPEMVPERVLDTLLGAGVGIVIAVLLSTMDDRRHLAELRSRHPGQTPGSFLHATGRTGSGTRARPKDG